MNVFPGFPCHKRDSKPFGQVRLINKIVVFYERVLPGFSNLKNDSGSGCFPFMISMVSLSVKIWKKLSQKEMRLFKNNSG